MWSVAATHTLFSFQMLDRMCMAKVPCGTSRPPDATLQRYARYAVRCGWLVFWDNTWFWLPSDTYRSRTTDWIGTTTGRAAVCVPGKVYNSKCPNKGIQEYAATLLCVGGGRCHQMYMYIDQKISKHFQFSCAHCDQERLRVVVSMNIRINACQFPTSRVPRQAPIIL